MQTLSRGARGEAVRDIQARLAALGSRIDPGEHGEFGPTTEQAVREFQQRRRLMVDGRVGDDTWNELVEAGYSLGDRVLYLRYPYYRGDDVRALQAALNLLGFDAGREDGILGERTERATLEFQRNVGLPPDGIVGSTTVDAIGRLRPVAPGPGRADVREAEALRRLSASLDGSRIAIDPGHGPGDPGEAGPAGTLEFEATFWLATALVEELRARGASPFLLRTGTTNPPPAERARRANEGGAEILVALHLNSHGDPAAEGASTFYFGREDWSSQAGGRLAESIQQALTEGLHLKDLRTHPKSLPLLRETRMPTVHVEPCFITNAREESLIRDPAFRGEFATAVADAVERFFGGGGPEQDRAGPATGSDNPVAVGSPSPERRRPGQGGGEQAGTQPPDPR
jgi:N-acetylmuramoyl-L-alanine amidase